MVIFNSYVKLPEGSGNIISPAHPPTVEPQQRPGSNQYSPGEENPTVYLLVV